MRSRTAVQKGVPPPPLCTQAIHGSEKACALCMPPHTLRPPSSSPVSVSHCRGVHSQAGSAPRSPSGTPAGESGWGPGGHTSGPCQATARRPLSELQAQGTCEVASVRQRVCSCLNLQVGCRSQEFAAAGRHLLAEASLLARFLMTDDDVRVKPSQVMQLMMTNTRLDDTMPPPLGNHGAGQGAGAQAPTVIGQGCRCRHGCCAPGGGGGGDWLGAGSPPIRQQKHELQQGDGAEASSQARHGPASSR